MDGAPLAGSASPESFGAVEDDGTVTVRMPDGSRRTVGQFAAGPPREALALYARRYTDLLTEIDLAAKRLAGDRSTPAQAAAVVERIREAIANPRFVGDIAALVARLGQLEVLISVKKAAWAALRERARQQTMEERERLTAEAEGISASESWKAGGERLIQIVAEWKALPHVDRHREQVLWKRVSAARSEFEKRRRSHYSRLDAERDESKRRKEALIAEAQKLSGSRDWDATTKEYRKLLDRWKQVGRCGKAEENLWQRFREAQDGFFAARKEVLDKQGEKESEALSTKENLLVAAEKLLPVSDLSAAKRELRAVQEKWEKAGKVPRADVKRIEARLRAVEEAVRAAEQQRWKKANPELKGRASDTVGAFRAKIDKLELQARRAASDGDEEVRRRLEAELAGARQLLEAAERGLARYS